MIRILKLSIAIMMPALLALAVAWPYSASLWAQSAPNPLVVPQSAPSAPPQLAQPAATAGIPPLITIPSPAAAATPVSAVRVFNCSCFGPATGANWIGRVSASGYFAARQSATGACLSSNTNRSVQPPTLPLSPTTSVQRTATATVPALPLLSGPTAGTLPGSQAYSTAEQRQMCSQCTCN
jgi:hypothetical protein